MTRVDKGRICIWWIRVNTVPITMFLEVIDDLLSICDNQPLECGRADLLRLRQAFGYWAPEIRETRFWYGTGRLLGIVDICNAHFTENNEVRARMNKFTDEHY